MKTIKAKKTKPFVCTRVGLSVNGSQKRSYIVAAENEERLITALLDINPQMDIYPRMFRRACFCQAAEGKK
jgi:hypothetical protein